MFSGFKSILFGSSEPQQATNLANANNNNPSQLEEINQASSINENAKLAPSVFLEQTLNAATTKFTEQLLPQQASIDQLQSSSHQLLPSLNDQQEQQLVKVEQKFEEVHNNDEDDDLIADSWELLDLVENKESINEDDGIQMINHDEPSLSANVIVEQQQQICKSSSGILKSSSNIGSLNQQQQQQQQARQKPKVSFNTPDLVKSKRQNKIERANEAKQVANKNDKSANNKANNESNKKDRQAATKRANSKLVKKPKPLNNSSVSKINCDTEDVFPYLSEPQEFSSDGRQAKRNYAAVVVASKQNIDTTDASELKEIAAGQTGSDFKQNLSAAKSVKRHRLNSTSDLNLSVYQQLQNVSDNKLGKAAKTSGVDDGEDNESIVSSGFSDCDYEYKGLDDYVMRPKRHLTKRGRNNKSAANLSQNTRRKSVSSSSLANSSDNNNKTDDGIMFVAPKVTLASTSSTKATNKGRKLELANDGDYNQQQQVASMGLNCNLGETSNSNDSSDIADMDESWYVTPPPCFTGANRSTISNDEISAIDCKQATNKINLTMINETPLSSEAALIENALIEHPSIYIASSSSSSKTKSSNVVCGDAEKFKLVSSKQRKSIVLRKVKSSRESSKAAAQAYKSRNKTSSLQDGNSCAGSKSDKLAIVEDDALMSDDLDEFWNTTTETVGTAGRPPSGPRNRNKTAASYTTSNKHHESVVKCESSSACKVVPSAPKTKSTSVAAVVVEGAAAVTKSQRARKQLASSGSSGSSLNSSLPATAASQKSTLAWRNKFIVDDWDLDDQEGPASDFDVMFEPVRKKKAVSKTKRKQQKLQSCTTPSPPPPQPQAVKFVESSNVEPPPPPPVDDATKSAATKDPSVVVKLIDDNSKENETEQLASSSVPSSEALAPQSATAKRPATQVRPIEPERKPGWQLKRQRPKRRPLAATGNGTVGKAATKEQRRCCSSASSKSSLSSSPANSSARSTPTLIDRIGSSIVANLSNLTSGCFAPAPPTGACQLLLCQHSAASSSSSSAAVAASCLVAAAAAAAGASGGVGERHAQYQQQPLLAAANGRASKLATLGETRAMQLVARKQLARNSLRRQNGVACGQASQRRADRRLRMFARPNGCSVNRKVQSNY